MEKQIKKAYSEIFRILNKNKDVICFDVDNLEKKSKLHLFGAKLKYKYGLDLNDKDIYSLDYNKFGEHIFISPYGKKYNRTISWSDDDKQPTDEILLGISFPTGAYIFGVGGMFDEDYPVNLFNKFFNELKTYKPKYIDSRNSSIYFSLDNSKDIFNNFNNILKKYYEINKEDYKKRKIAKMKSEIEKLENN